MRYPGCISIDSKPLSDVIITMILDTHESMAKSVYIHIGLAYISVANQGPQANG